MIKNLNKTKGFTLIELLVVMLILGIIGTISVGILTGALRGGNKGATINDVRQNGNYVISQMSKMIAYAQDFEGVCQKGGSVTCDNASDYSLVCPDPLQSYSNIRIKNFDGGETIFSCNSPTDTPASTVASRSADVASSDSLIDTSRMTVTACNIYCEASSPAISPTLTIVFTLSTNGTLAENASQITFETSVKPRNNPIIP